MTKNVKKLLKKQRRRSYLARDFTSFRADLLRYARTYFPDKIQDFTESSFAGLLLDMAAMVGDTMSFYLDHQFNELNWLTAVESQNIQRHLDSAGVEASGAAPAVADVSFLIEVPSEPVGSVYRPMYVSLPKIMADTVVSAGGVDFTLVNDVDFSLVDATGNLACEITVATTSDDGSPATYIVEKVGQCISGKIVSEGFDIPNFHKPFRKLTLTEEDVTSIISVKDTQGNEYYEVSALTQDSVFSAVINTGVDGDIVSSNLEIIPAPYRYLKAYDVRSGLTTLTFGGGNAESLDDDIIPDPSELALPLYGKKTFTRFSIDPNALLDTQTLGIAPLDTTLTVKYRAGGGIANNVAASSIRTISTLYIEFPNRVDALIADAIRASVDITNRLPASGGDGAPTLDELRYQIPAALTMQDRVVTKQDMIARIYSMPSDFGRVFRAAVRPNDDNPLASELYIICRDKDENLTVAPDALKKNLRTYLNEFRLISDAFDVLDTRVVNYGVRFAVTTDPKANKSIVVQAVIQNISNLLDIKFFQIDQPIVLADIVNVIINTDSVISLLEFEIFNIRGIVEERMYNPQSFNVIANTRNGMLIGPPGSIFELKHPEFDIIGTAL